jgi:hypothetical protein
VGVAGPDRPDHWPGPAPAHRCATSPDLELRHRRHARVEDRIRAGKDTGLCNLPFHDAAQNRVWLEVCALAAELIAFTQRLALTGWARIAEPKRLRLRLFGVAGRVVRTGRRRVLKIPRHLALGRAHDQRTRPARTPGQHLTGSP